MHMSYIKCTEFLKGILYEFLKPVYWYSKEILFIINLEIVLVLIVCVYDY